MELLEGLMEYVDWEPYRKALGLPEKRTETYEPLAQGEYNRNYRFLHPITKKQLVLRINFGSQMHLEHQIEYEYHALKLLERSGRTPKAFYADGSLKKLPHGVLVMEFLPGRELDYRKEMARAAECLADIHSVPADESCGLLHPKDPLRAILEECESMAAFYMESGLGDLRLKNRIRSMLDLGWERWRKTKGTCGYECCINTELNSTNFLANGTDGTCYLVDWEKPLYGEPAQDLGHFLAPTTTFWKTDVILTEKEMDGFLDDYIRAVGGRFPTDGLKERTFAYIPITCLRGITWCAMAWVEYQQPGRLLQNASTWKKLNAYLDHGFFNPIEALLK